MEQLRNLTSPSNAFIRFWMKVPLVVRSMLIGLIVSSLGVGLWVLLATKFPFPWSMVAMGTLLILYWMYFSGKWKPLNTQAPRRFRIRRTTLNRPVWIWGMAAAFFIFILMQGSWILTFRMVEFQPEIFKTSSFLNDLPPWTSWSLIVMGSLVAGICEEVGFRGYMQAPLEEKYGPVAAISVTSLVFVVVHLHQAWASGMLPGIFGISFMIGYLAYATNSLLPGIIAHVSFDIFNFAYWWSDVMGTYERKPISMTGADMHFFVSLMVVLVSILLFVAIIRKLLKIRNLAK